MGADLSGCDMTGARLYGASLWDVTVCENDALRQHLIATPVGAPEPVVNNLDVAQFSYALLSTRRIAPALDGLTEKCVLILGRFTPERLAVLRALRTALRNKGFVPIVCDFEPPKSLSLTETIQMFVSMSAFVIIDLTKPRATPYEAHATIPGHMIPFVPLIQEGEKPFDMFRDLLAKHGSWVLPELEYRDEEELLAVLDKAVIAPAKAKREELLEIKRRVPVRRRASDYLQG